MPERAEILRCEGSELVGIVHEPAAAGETGLVIIVAGGPQYRVGAHRQFVMLARQVAEAGIPALRFDHRGTGDSDGEYRGFKDMDADIRTAVDYLFDTYPGLKQVALWGECESASAAAYYAYSDKRVGGIFLVNPWVRTDAGLAKTYLRHHYTSRLVDPEFWKKVKSGQFSVSESLASIVSLIKEAAGDAETGRLLAEYHHLIQADDLTDMKALARVQQQLEAQDGWQLQQRVETTISQLDLPADASMSELSGGWRRRVALAQALVSKPDILLLDEPTNHLDIPAIAWLEEQLQNFKGALILITHDRRFLQNVANWMAELDRGSLTLWSGNYQGFLRHREQQLLAEERANELFDKKLAQEEVWIRQGIKARRTRNEGRVRALKDMRDRRSERRERVGNAGFIIEDSARSGKIVAELENVSHSFDDNRVINNFSTIIQRGDRIGIIGSNGAGKTTLVKILLGELEPSEGKVSRGTKLEVAYSDQLRDQLDPEKNLIDNVCGGQEFIEIGGRRRHAISYLGDFLFSPDRVRMPVKALSGGEQNRAVLARLFCKSANLLVLDEPTNDLDIETLELLEEILLTFEGTVLLVSHDRDFMDNVVTSLLVLDGTGNIDDCVGGYSDWVRQGGSLSDAQSQKPVKPAKNQQIDQASKPEPAAVKKAKLSYNDQRELGRLPGKIEKLEKRQSELEQKMAEPGFFQSDSENVARMTSELAEVMRELETAFNRWGELEP